MILRFEQRILLTFGVISILSYNDSSRITNITHEDVSSIGQQTDAGWATIPYIGAHVTYFMISLLEAIYKSGVNLRQ